jgi:hypothetical protein
MKGEVYITSPCLLFVSYGEILSVQEQIEQQAKTARPRRSRSFSRNDLISETSASGASMDTPAVPKQRQSVDSSISNGSNPISPSRPSVEKGRGKAIFKTSSRTGGNNGSSHLTDAKHHRTNSLLGDKKMSLTLPENAPDANLEISPDDDVGFIHIYIYSRTKGFIPVFFFPSRTDQYRTLMT